ncbi:MAG: hypothetical protein AAGJ46_15895 [Planctomycetota bacterium]
MTVIVAVIGVGVVALVRFGFRVVRMIVMIVIVGVPGVAFLAVLAAFVVVVAMILVVMVFSVVVFSVVGRVPGHQLRCEPLRDARQEAGGVRDQHNHNAGYDPAAPGTAVARFAHFSGLISVKTLAGNRCLATPAASTR